MNPLFSLINNVTFEMQKDGRSEVMLSDGGHKVVVRPLKIGVALAAFGAVSTSCDTTVVFGVAVALLQKFLTTSGLDVVT